MCGSRELAESPKRRRVAGLRGQIVVAGNFSEFMQFRFAAQYKK